LLLQPTGWTDEALQAADDQILNELAARHFPRPQTKKDWEHIALIAEIPADKVLSGNLSLREIHACALAWADRQKIKARLSGASERAEESRFRDYPERGGTGGRMETGSGGGRL
jgi:hypothetical protein